MLSRGAFEVSLGVSWHLIFSIVPEAKRFSVKLVVFFCFRPCFH